MTAAVADTGEAWRGANADEFFVKVRGVSFYRSTNPHG
jgi:hypothetical protein